MEEKNSEKKERKMRDSGIPWIGEVPEGWECSRIGGFYSPRMIKVSDVDYQPLSVTMKGIVHQLETAAKTNDHNNRKLVKKGDFAINSRSDRRGSCGISKYDGSVSLINTVLSPNVEMCPQFFDWLFHTTQFSDEFYKWGHGIIDDLWTTGWQDMKKINIPVPPISEQHRIADFLDSKCSEIDTLIENLRARMESAKEYKKAVITEAVTKGLDKDAKMKDSGVEWIGEVPEEWKVSRIGHDYNVTLGKMLDSKEYDQYEMNNYLCAANIKWSGVNTSINKKMKFSSSEKPLYLLQKDDVLIMEGGTAGTSCIYNNEFAPCYIQNSVHRCRAINNNISKYLYYWMYVVFYSGYINSICNKATILHYTKEKVEKTPIVLPSIGEQKSIVNYLDSKCSEIDALLQNYEDQIATLEEYKKSLIYEYVTGKKEVPAA